MFYAFSSYSVWAFDHIPEFHSLCSPLLMFESCHSWPRVSSPTSCSICVFLHVCLCSMCVPGACRGQRKALGPLVLELQTVVSCYVVPGTRTWVLWKSSQCHWSNYWAVSPLCCPPFIYIWRKTDQKPSCCGRFIVSQCVTQCTLLSKQLYLQILLYWAIRLVQGLWPLLHYQYWILSGTPLGYPVVALCCGDPAALHLQGWALH